MAVGGGDAHSYVRRVLWEAARGARCIRESRRE